VLKGLDGALEVVGGLLLLLVTPTTAALGRQGTRIDPPVAGIASGRRSRVLRRAQRPTGGEPTRCSCPLTWCERGCILLSS